MSAVTVLTSLVLNLDFFFFPPLVGVVGEGGRGLFSSTSGFETKLRDPVNFRLLAKEGLLVDLTRRVLPLVETGVLHTTSFPSVSSSL